MARQFSERCIILIIGISVLLPTTVIAIQQTFATTLSKEAPPPPSIFTNGTEITLAGDAADIDIAIDPTDDLPANGTQTVSTTGATDMDINEFPPQGVSVLIQNDTVTVTNHTVEVGNDFTDAAVESNDDGGDSNDDEGEGEGDE